ncbi:MAG: galactose mutarotase [Rikenellaceae bacterium]|jgi:aldose 1-epimerase|nr:galactose mutarotase [Rikenellaceae bacterium]
MKKILLFAAVGLVAVACGGKQQPTGPILLDEAAFATTLDGKTIELYTLTNENGAVLQLTNYGCRMLSMWVPDRDGNFRDVIWGYESAGDMLAGDASSGSVVGRYGNRIDKGRFTLDSVEYQLNLNDGANHLHGGVKGWSQKVWDGEQFIDEAGNGAVKMTLVSPAGDELYPGEVTIEVTYTLTADNAVDIAYRATTDAPTVLNPTNHAYFNLHGTAAQTILSHVLTLNADSFTPTDSGLIPTGEIALVEGTPLDFRTPTAIGERIDSPDCEAIVFGKGYDHNWVLNKAAEGEVSVAAVVYEPSTGIELTVLTDQPGIQFYSGNFMNGTGKGKYGEVNAFRSGLALEAQHYPDSPNHPDFPTTVLRPGETYTQHTVYAFSVRK